MQSPGHSISAVIIARNEERTLQRCVEATLAQTCGVREVVVVDGNSTDRTAEIAEAMSGKDPRVRLVREDPDAEQKGPAAARNFGASLSSGDLILFLNADVSVGPDYMEQLAQQMDVDELDAAAGLRWNERGPLVAGLMNVHYALNYNTAPATLAQPAFLSGDALLVRRQAFDSIGGYDVTMPAGEDADLGYRMRDAGFRIAYRRDLTVWHNGRHYRSLGGWLRQMAWYGRGAAALAQAHPQRRQRERVGLLKHVLLPGAAVTAAVALAVAAAITGIMFLWMLVAAACAAVCARYLLSFLRVRKVCRSARLPWQPSSVHLLAYPLFRSARYGLLSAFTWMNLLRDGRDSGPARLGDAGL
jgi:cellulose synthase/poly-beta-1,6-N-acetylglucosamine synthase-like glycosyltransferase